jgi:hypothetical protein
MFARDGTELRPTRAFITSTAAFYRGQLFKQASAKQRSGLKERRARVSSGVKLDRRQRLLVDVVLLDWLIQEVNPPDAERLLGINYHLKQALQPNDIPKVLRGRLARARLTAPRRSKQAVRSPSASALVTTARGQAYRALCEQNGVPIPPDWGTSQWVKQGTLKDPFISTNLEAEVFAYRSPSPAGVVIALPRYEVDVMNRPTGRITLLGIISLGKQSGKVCFWDNQTGNPLSPKFFPQRNEVVPFDRFGGGADLRPDIGGECSNCHAGENPYVIHPATVLGQLRATLPTFADRYYEPIVPSGFAQNSIPNFSAAARSGTCANCHTMNGTGGRFPELSTNLLEYCGTIFDQAVRRTMPPGNPGSLANDPQVVALRSQCGQPLSPRTDAANFVSQTPPPATVVTGSLFTVSVSFANIGTTAWTGLDTLFFAPPSSGGSIVWRATATLNSSVGTPTRPLFPLDALNRTVTVLAPTTPGTYEFALVLRNPAGTEIARSPVTQVNVVSPNAFLLIPFTVPSSVPSGSGALVTMLATNTGSTTWTAADHFARLSRTMRISLPQTSVALPAGDVAPGASVTLLFQISCNGQGEGSFGVQMQGPAGPFGPSVSRRVVCT